MKLFQFLSVFGVTTAVTAGALACGGGEHGGPRADSNGDGKVTLAEADATLKARFATFDKNKDNVITEAELGEGPRGLFKRADANNDNKVTIAEAQAKMNEWFAKRDANGDKVLDGDEMRRGKHGKRGKGHGPRA